ECCDRRNIGERGERRARHQGNCLGAGRGGGSRDRDAGLGRDGAGGLRGGRAGRRGAARRSRGLPGESRGLIPAERRDFALQPRVDGRAPSPSLTSKKPVSDTVPLPLRDTGPMFRSYVASMMRHEWRLAVFAGLLACAASTLGFFLIGPAAIFRWMAEVPAPLAATIASVTFGLAGCGLVA